MNPKQATELHKHLTDAADALDQASKVIFELPKEERGSLADQLGRVVSTLHFEMIPVIYAHHPELRPSEQRPTVSGSLRWEDVVLPSTVSEGKLDEVIFGVLTPRWQKIALVVGKSVNRCTELGYPVSADALAARIQALGQAKRLEIDGNPIMWRHSEVRLNQG